MRAALGALKRLQRASKGFKEVRPERHELNHNSAPCRALAKLARTATSGDDDVVGPGFKEVRPVDEALTWR